MRPVLKSIPKAYIALLGVFAGLVLLAPADAADDAAKGTARGGLLVTAEGHRFEVFFFPSGLRLFPQDASGKALDATTVSAVATFFHPNSPQPWFSRDLVVSAVPLGERPTGLELGLDLSTVPTSGASVTFEVAGLEEAVIPFTVPFTLGNGPAPAPAPATVAASAPFVYAVGAQGVGYYANPRSTGGTGHRGTEAGLGADHGARVVGLFVEVGRPRRPGLVDRPAWPPAQALAQLQMISTS